MVSADLPTASEKHSILDTHNYHRGLVGSSNMEEMVRRYWKITEL